MVQTDDLIIKGTSRPGLLRISDNFGKEVKLFSIGGDLAIQLFADTNKQITGSLVIMSAAGEELIRIKQNGEIQYTKRAGLDPNTIQATKSYMIPVIDEVGNQKFINISGRKLATILK